jgi:cholesterol oxidase
VLNPRNGFLKDPEVLARVEVENLLRNSTNQRGVDPNADHSAVFLAMGRDRANGRISLHPLTFSLDIEWPLQPNMPLYDAEDRFVEVPRAENGPQRRAEPVLALRTPAGVSAQSWRMPDRRFSGSRRR